MFLLFCTDFCESLWHHLKSPQRVQYLIKQILQQQNLNASLTDTDNLEMIFSVAISFYLFPKSCNWDWDWAVFFRSGTQVRAKLTNAEVRNAAKAKGVVPWNSWQSSPQDGPKNQLGPYKGVIIPVRPIYFRPFIGVQKNTIYNWSLGPIMAMVQWKMTEEL